MATRYAAAPPAPPEEAPDQLPDTPPDEGDAPEQREPPAEASSLNVEASPEAASWDDSYRSALDNPQHPLHHLRNA